MCGEEDTPGENTTEDTPGENTTEDTPGGNTTESYLDDDSDDEGSTISFYNSVEDPYFPHLASYYNSVEDDVASVDDKDRASEDEYVDDEPECLNEDVSEPTVPDSKDVLNDIWWPKVFKFDYPSVVALESSKHNKDVWLKSMPKVSEKAWVDVYSYCSQERGAFGGYAVIVRNMSAKPIVAAATFIGYGQTYLHQVLKGLQTGLDLARKHGCASPDVLCNSKLVVHLLTSIASDRCCPCGIKTVDTSICEECAWNSVSHLNRNYFKRLVPLIEKIQEQRGSATFRWLSREHEAAHCLAKYVKKKAREYGKFSIKAIFETPEDFPDELVDILLKDAYDTDFYNLEGRTGIEVSEPPTGNTSKN